MTNSRYNLSTLKQIAHPKGFRGVLQHFGLVCNQEIHRRFVDPNGSDFTDEDWDTMLILDGCRHDLFMEECELDGQIETRRSHASYSGGFIAKNFIGRTLHDTVYITANVYAENIPDNTFHYVDNLLDNTWNDKLGTVHPGDVADATRDALERFPNKRVIAHFMQPHYPFIGNRALDLDLDTGEIDRTGFGQTIWQMLQYGLTELNENEVWDLYAENLRVALDSVAGLLEEPTGKTVITADHGNLVGDRLWPVPVRGYGHPPNVYVDELLTVPWMVVDGERRTIQTEPPIDSERLPKNKIEERLRALGYR